MAERSEQLTYELVIDTGKAEKQVHQFSEDAGKTINAGAAGTAAASAAAAAATGSTAAAVPQAANSSAISVMGQDTLATLRKIAIPAATILTNAGFVANIAKNIVDRPLHGLAEGVMDVGGKIGEIGSYLTQMGSEAGPAVEAIGKLVDAIGQVTDKLVSLAEQLSDYSPSLFDAMTQLEVGFEGLKYQMAYQLGPVLADFMLQLGDIVYALGPELAEFLRGLTVLLSGLWRVLGPLLTLLAKILALLAPVLAMIGNMLDALGMLVEQIGIVVDVFVDLGHAVTRLIEDFSSGNFSNLWQNLVDNVTGAFDTIVTQWHSVIDGVTGLLGATNKTADNTEAMKRMMMEAQGLAGSGGLFYAMQAWAENQADVQRNRAMPNPQLPAPQQDQAPRGAGAAGRHGAPQGGVPIAHAARDFVMNGGEAPRPAPAALHFRVADAINVQAADEDRLAVELSQMRQFVLEQLRGQGDARWLRLAGMRDSLRAALG